MLIKVTANNEGIFPLNNNNNEVIGLSKTILFNTEMVKAILDGRKTTTRRIIKDVNGLDFIGVGIEPKEIENTAAFGHGSFETIVDAKIEKHVKAPYKPGDIIYVRETWVIQSMSNSDKRIKFMYKALGDKDLEIRYVDSNRYERLLKYSYKSGWQPSLFMPKEAARIFLKVTNVKVERLKGIEYDNLISEGTKIPRFATEEALQANFKSLWDSTLKKEQLDIYSWEANPWVWAIEFERVEKQ